MSSDTVPAEPGHDGLHVVPAEGQEPRDVSLGPLPLAPGQGPVFHLNLEWLPLFR